jgi:hypothetical protein
MKLIVAAAILMLVASCGPDDTRMDTPLPSAPSQSTQPLERALIVGSAETPDPVLTRVRELEKAGIVKDVVVLESFPAQIHLTASRDVIEELNKIPRIGGLR